MMETKGRKSKKISVLLWAAQAILSVSLLWAAGMKLFQSPAQLAALWPWTAANTGWVKLTGIVDLLAGIGLVLPALLRYQIQLTVYAAYGTMLLMLAAIIFHISRGEGSLTGINILFLLLAIFIAWGRKRLLHPVVEQGQ